jgi:hypothetical protein
VNLEIEWAPPISNPSEADVRAELSKLNPAGPRFAVLDLGPHRYIQAYAEEVDALHLEYRDGGPDRAYEVGPAQTRADVTEAFVSYLHEDNRWRTAFEWRRREAGQ